MIAVSRHSRGHQGTELVAFLRHDERVVHAQQQLRGMIRDLLTEGTRTGDVRDDVSPDELAAYCLHAYEHVHGRHRFGRGGHRLRQDTDRRRLRPGRHRPSSWDCSSLMQATFKQAGISLPHVSQDQSTVGTPGR
ncbi:NlpC/P60 family protein [Streptomyces longisporus]|uniref:NlpC/P60 domain-containing protein n=1 Tax=Streptomyces longisporus TaxID=1948 RepID=A0ABN3LWN8_STRLO